jgi:sterol desaturase/sphingolipid hydroxylase (fatty acid hydroxylase superfamily)
MALPPAVEVIQATLAPAFMISGTSVFLNFAQNRLFRVMDRTRSQQASDEAGGRDRLLKRARLLRNAIAFGVLTVGLTIVSAILVMASELFGLDRLAASAPYTFALALLAFFTALLLVFYDTTLSVRSVESRK